MSQKESDMTEKFQKELSDIALKMQKNEYENNNLRDERELFVGQINQLEGHNKNQEKMIV